MVDAYRTIEQRDATIARQAFDLAEVGEERDFYKRCLDCPDPVVGRAMPALAEELHRSYRHGSPHVQDGHEFARLNFERAAEGKPINRGAIATAAERLGPATPRVVLDAIYQRDGRDVPTKHHLFACPVEERVSVARLGLGLLGRANPQKRHQGRKPAREMPPAVAEQDAPVRREHRTVETFYSLRDDSKLATQTTIGTADYWTPEGEQITQDEARAWQVAHGVIAPGVETQHRSTQPQSLFVGERPPAVEFQQKSTNDRAVEFQQRGSPIPEDVPGQCAEPDCGQPVTTGGRCAAHWGEYLERSRRHTPWDFAAGAD